MLSPSTRMADPSLDSGLCIHASTHLTTSLQTGYMRGRMSANRLNIIRCSAHICIFDFVGYLMTGRAASNQTRVRSPKLGAHPELRHPGWGEVRLSPGTPAHDLELGIKRCKCCNSTHDGRGGGSSRTVRTVRWEDGSLKI